jgi:putative heme-binding domain-containing protein
VLKALKDKNEHLRERAIACAERTVGDHKLDDDLSIALGVLASDTSARVRFQLALSAGNLIHLQEPQDEAGKEQGYVGNGMLIDLLDRLSVDREPFIADAIASAQPMLGTMLFNAFLGTRKENTNPELLIKLASVAGAFAKGNDLQGALANLSEKPDAKLIRAFAVGLKRAGTTIAKVDTEKKLSAVFTKAADTASDSKSNEASRLEALSLLSLATFKESSPTILACLAKGQPEAIQASAISSLGQFNTAEATTALLDHWPDLAPKARAVALNELLSRPDRTLALLKKVEGSSRALPPDGKAPEAPSTFPTPADFSPSQIQALLKSENKAIADLAKTALASVIPPSRESVLAKYQPALATKGDMAKGQLVFLQRCIACHRAAGQGIQVGPDFVTVKTKGKEALMTAILDPHKEVAPQFIAYTVNTKDGQTLAGIVTKDDASSMTIKMMGGAEIHLPRANIKGSTSSGQSLMPEGIEAGMTVQDMADLLEFIEKAN